MEIQFSDLPLGFFPFCRPTPTKDARSNQPRQALTHPVVFRWVEIPASICSCGYDQDENYPSTVLVLFGLDPPVAPPCHTVEGTGRGHLKRRRKTSQAEEKSCEYIEERLTVDPQDGTAGRLQAGFIQNSLTFD